MLRVVLQSHGLRWRDFVTVVVVGILSISAVGCSSSSPSESAGRKVLEHISRDSREMWTVKSFAKTNGVDHGAVYRMEFEADLECQRAARSLEFMFPRFNGFRCNRVGEIHKVKSYLDFQKTEKGWRAEDNGEVY